MYTGIALIALSLAPASQTTAPSADYTASLHLPSMSTYVAVSSVWATANVAMPTLIQMPVTVETMPPADGTTTGDQDAIVLAAGEETMHGPDQWGILSEPTMEHLALEWGLAEIGPGVLAPQPPLGGGSPGGGSPGGSGSGSGDPLAPGNPVFVTINSPIVDDPASGGGEPVPEPMSGLLWLFVLAIAAFKWARANPNQEAATWRPCGLAGE